MVGRIGDKSPLCIAAMRLCHLGAAKRDPAPACPKPPRPIGYSDALEHQNRLGAAAGPVPFADVLASDHRLPPPRHQISSRPTACPDVRREQHAAPRIPCRPTPRAAFRSAPDLRAPRLADFPPLPRLDIDRRARLIRRIATPPIRPGRVIDVLV